MSRILIVLSVAVPTAALAHPGAHGQDFWGNLAHALGQSDHLAAGVAALALPVAVGVIIWRRFK